MKGIILAGGKGTRLHPITMGVCKQLLPVYDKPMVYYPLSVLMLAGIKDILLISDPDSLPGFENLFGNGSALGISISYAPQKEPRGIAEGLIIGASFTGKDRVCLILGDNIFFGHGLTGLLREAAREDKGAVIFAHPVSEPSKYGVVEFDRKMNVLSIQEKPEKPRSRWAATGLYFYDNQAREIAKKLAPSGRGELEITELNNEYLKKGMLKALPLGRGFAWLDTGTCESLIDASMFIKTIEERQGLKIGCIEEVAYRMGHISRSRLKEIAGSIRTSYGDYLLKIVSEDEE